MLAIFCSADSEIIEEGAGYRYFPRRTRFYTVAPALSRWVRRHVQDFDILHLHSPIFLFHYCRRPSCPPSWSTLRHSTTRHVKQVGIEPPSSHALNESR